MAVTRTLRGLQQEGDAKPTHTAELGTEFYDTVTNMKYINEGGTSWRRTQEADGNQTYWVDITWLELVALPDKKAGDRFDLSNSDYAGHIILASPNTFKWINALNQEENIIIM